jgi:hypothetical protein
VGTAPEPNSFSVSFSASPASLTIQAGMSGTLTVTAKPQSGSFNSSISLSCSGIPNTLSCSFYPATITPGSGTPTSTLTVSATTAAAANLPPLPKSPALYFSWLLPFGLLGPGFSRQGPRKRGVQALALCAVIGLGMFGASCGGGKTVGTNRSAASNPTSYSVTMNGNTSVSKLSTVVNILVQ